MDRRVRCFALLIVLAGWSAHATAIAGETAGTRSPASVVADIALDHGGLLGRVVDDRGRSAANVEIVLSHGPHELHRTATDSEGWFVVPQLAVGQYELSAGGVRSTYRLWPDRVAPPTAGEYALIVLTPRGGHGVVQPATGDAMVLVTVGVILAVIAAAIGIDRVHRLPPTVAEADPLRERRAA